MLFKTQTSLGSNGKPLKQSGRAIVGYLQSIQLAYNANHELTQSVTITQQGLDLTEVTTTYQYDAFGRRISKQTQTKEKTRQVNRQSAKIIKFPVQQQKTKHSQVNYLWDGNRQLQEQTDTHIFTTIYEQDSFEPVARLVWLQDGIEIAANEPVYNDNPHTKPETNKPSKIQMYHCHNDHLGTPNELTNQDGEVVWLADYEAYGNTAKVVWREEKLESVQVTAEELQPIRFQGQSFDVETGLHYNRFRYFDPDLGMFTTRDPIGLLGGSNVFQYAPNPTGWIDPFGLSRYPTVTFPSTQVLADVTIQMQGHNDWDFKAANDKAEILGKSGKPTINAHRSQYGQVTWHHAGYDAKTNTARMQLVLTADHEKTFPHSGAVSQFEKEHNVKYGTPEAKAKASELKSNKSAKC